MLFIGRKLFRTKTTRKLRRLIKVDFKNMGENMTTLVIFIDFDQEPLKKFRV